MTAWAERRLGGVRLSWLLGLGVLGVTACVFAPVLGYDFVVWDDDLHVYANPRLQAVSWAQVMAFWRAPYEQLYMPLTYTVWAAVTWVIQAFNQEVLWARILHGVNLGVHLGSVWVVYQLLQCLGGSQTDFSMPESRAWTASIGALVFGIHPLQVEAVAWVSGLKDVLCGWWSLVAVWQYLRAVQTNSTPPWWGHYGVATGAYALALLAKPTAVVVPVLAGLLAIGGLGQAWRTAGWALGGWLVVALGWSGWSKGLQPDMLLGGVPSWPQRVLVAADTVVFYVGKMLWPVGLGPDYGRTPQVVLEQGGLWVVSLAVLGGALGLWWIGRRWESDLRLATAVSVVALLPGLGLVAFAFQAYSTVADRYAYLAVFGVALGISTGLQRWGHHRVCWGLTTLLVVSLIWRSGQQVTIWRDTTTLFTHALQVNPRSALAYNNLGWTLARHGRLDQAITHYHQALQLRPYMLEARYNLGDALAEQGKLQEAVAQYTAILQHKPAWPEVHNNLGTALMRQGKLEEARQRYQEALRMKPDWSLAANNMGDVLVKQRRLDEALAWFARASQYQPAIPEAPYNLAVLLWQRGRIAEAMAAYREALRRRPHWLQAASHLAWLLATQQEPSPQDAAEAVALAEHVCQASDDKNPIALRTLAAAYHAAGQRDAAVRATQRALTAARALGDTVLVAELTAQLTRYEKED